jgi:hypothetical protein
LPQSPAKYAKTVDDLIVKATPRKKKALTEAGLTTSDDDMFHRRVSAVVKKMFVDRLGSGKKRSQEKKNLAQTMNYLKKYRMLREVSVKFGISRKSLKLAHPRQVCSDSVPEETNKAVIAFLEDSAVHLPVKKRVSKKTLIPKAVLQRPMGELHTEFKVQNPSLQIGYSKFCEFRPAHILLHNSNKLCQCLCEYCINIELMIRAVNRISVSCKRPEYKIPDVYKLSSRTVCPREEGAQFHKQACVTRECQHCGVQGITTWLNQLLEMHTGEIEWYQYESEIVVKKNNGNGNTVNQETSED